MFKDYYKGNKSSMYVEEKYFSRYPSWKLILCVVASLGILLAAVLIF